MILRTTADILSGHSEKGFQDKSLEELEKLRKSWDYSRELQIEDVDLWETIIEYAGGGIYASWLPYAEFYMLIVKKEILTFYGKGAQKHLIEEAKSHNIKVQINTIFVDPEDMWIYE